MTNDEFSEMMQASAEDSVALARNDYDYSLDYTVDSIQWVDHILDNIKQQPLGDKELFTYSYIFGAYLGEVYIRNAGGEWLFISETADEPPQTFVKKGDNTFAFPSKVYHILMENESQPLAEYFNELIQPQTH